jgi:hypothetical protein
MATPPTSPKDDGRALPDVLLGYLLSAWAWPPGCDGITTEEVLDSYPAAVAAGVVPDWANLLSRHPTLAPDLYAWLQVLNRWRFLDSHSLPEIGISQRPG